MNNFFGKKVGMTQVFTDDGTVIPVTVVDVSGWIVTQKKSKDKDGYTAIQVGLPRKKYRGADLSKDEVVKKKKRVFLHIREIKLESDGELEKFEIGQRISFSDAGFQEGEKIAVQGVSKGKGFQGVVKRHGFAGGPAAHGSKFHRIPGSVGNLRTCGNIPKGKKLPGHAGVKTITIRGLSLVKMDEERGVVMIKGALPGYNGALVKISKQ